MSFFGKSLRDYARFARTGMILIVLMGLARFTVGLSGVPYESATNLVSMTILAMILCFVYGHKAATEGFGGYRHLLPTVSMLALSMYGFIVVAIPVEGLGGLHGYFHSPGSGLAPSRMDVAAHVRGQLLAMLISTPTVFWILASLGFLLSRYVGFLRNAFLLLVAMAVLRLLVGAAGVPYAIGTWFTSITLLAMALCVYYGYRGASDGFSSYWQAGLLGALIMVAETLLVIYGIAVTTGPGIPNYFHAPGEGIQPAGMSVARHIRGHLIVTGAGIPVLGLLAVIGFALGKRRRTVPAAQPAS